MQIVALVPAYNEQTTIARTVAALRRQWAPRVNRIIVVPNNCTDLTAETAWLAGAEVWEMPGANPHRKAGALNWALDRLLPQLQVGDKVLVTDADSMLERDWTSHAIRVFNRVRWRHAAPIGAVCANFHIAKPRGLLGYAQAAEYSRFAQQVMARGRAIVLSGVATLFDVSALLHVKRERGRGLPGYVGEIYHRDPATEDIELTFAFWKLGYVPAAPRGAVAWTDTMGSWKALRNQRVRWQRGMLDTLRLYGFNRLTVREHLRQWLIYLGSLMVPAYLLFLLCILAASGSVPFDWRWLPVTGLFMVERAVTAGRGRRWFAAAIVFEWVYEQYRAAAYWLALWRTYRGASQVWIND
jgi:biofilm PGA synthesis N-glycosyltransferase PgaC